MSRIQKISLGALMIALGIITPLAFHAFGLGSTFLPMHIPVLLSGLLVGPLMAGAVGFLTPLLSGLLTGMPPFMPPIAQGMMVELALYGVAASLLSGKFRQNLYVSLVGAMLGGRIVYGILGSTMLPLLGFKAVPVLYPVTAGLVSGIPGVILQLIAVPVLVKAIGKAVPALKR